MAEPHLKTVLLAAAALVVAFLAARLTRPEGSQLALVAPAAAIGSLWLGTVWRRRYFRRTLALIPAVIVLATLMSGQASILLALVFAIANLAQAVVACWLTSRWSTAPAEPEHPQAPRGWQLRNSGDLGRLVLVAVASSVVAAVLTTAGLRWLELSPTSDLTVLEITVRNSVSVIVGVSLSLLVLDHLTGRAVLPAGSAGRVERTAMGFCLLGGYALVFWWNPGLPLAYSVLPLSTWYALRGSTVSTALQLVVVTLAVVTATVLGRGPFAGHPAGTTALLAQSFILLVHASSLLTALGRDERIRLLAQAELARVEAAEQSALLGSVFSSVSDGLSVLDRDGRTLLRNEAAEELLGPASTAATPQVWSDRFGIFRSDGSVFPPDELPVLRALRGEDVVGVDILVKSAQHPDGLVLNVSAHPLSAGTSVAWSGGAVAAYHDVTQVRAAADQLARTRDVLARQVVRDALTGLGNRTMLLERLEYALAEQAASGRQVGVLYLDLDGFKAVNDSAGHAAGDDLLCAVADLLSGCVRPGDTVARLGGDEFALVCPAAGEVGNLRAVADRIHAVLAEPVVVPAGIFRVGASIGIRLAERGERAEQLIRDADEAMYRSKRSGRGRTTLHEPVAEEVAS